MGAVPSTAALFGACLLRWRPAAPPPATLPAAADRPSATCSSDRRRPAHRARPRRRARAPTSICPAVDIRPGTATMAFTAATTRSVRAGIALSGRRSRRPRANAPIARRQSDHQGRRAGPRRARPGRRSRQSSRCRCGYALVQEGPSPKTLWTKVYHIPVTIPDGAPNVAFTHIEEAMSVPMPRRQRYRDLRDLCRLRSARPARSAADEAAAARKRLSLAINNRAARPRSP